MRPVLFLALAFASFAVIAFADEASDRASIERVVTALDGPQRGSGSFTSDFNNFAEIDRLEMAAPAGPTVVISHEPWGEATLVFPGLVAVHESHLIIRSVRFVTADVAVLDVSGEPNSDALARPSIPALFVMRKEGSDWKIASVRLLSQV